MAPPRCKKVSICLLIGVVIASAACMGWVLFIIHQSMAESERHDFYSSISLSYTTTIKNVTIMLPVPGPNGTPVLADAFINRSAPGIPRDWDLSIEEVKGTPMLVIRADRMVPEYHGYPIQIEPGQSPLPTTIAPRTGYSVETPVLWPVHIGTMVQVNRTIETRDPIGREPVFAYTGKFTLMEESAGPHVEGKEYAHPVPVYVWFEQEQPAEFSFQANIEGINSIWRGGWIFNRYEDSVSVELKGPQGWTEARGTLRVGEGVYYTSGSDQVERDGEI